MRMIKIWFFGNSRDETGVLKRSFSLVCPCEAFSEPGKPDPPTCGLARLAERFACQHPLKLRFSTPDHGNSQRAKNIWFVEGVRLDMKGLDSQFVLEVAQKEPTLDIEPIFDEKTEACFLVEVGPLPGGELPLASQSVFNITWL